MIRAIVLRDADEVEQFFLETTGMRAGYFQLSPQLGFAFSDKSFSQGQPGPDKFAFGFIQISLAQVVPNFRLA